MGCASLCPALWYTPEERRNGRLKCLFLKVHKEEIQVFAGVLRTSATCLISFDSIYPTTLATLKANESLEKKAEIAITLRG